MSILVGVALTAATVVVPTWTDEPRLLPAIAARPSDVEWVRSHAPHGLLERAGDRQGLDLAFAGLAQDQRFAARDTSGIFWFVDQAGGRPSGGAAFTRFERGWPLLCTEGSWWQSGPEPGWIGVDLIGNQHNMSQPVLPYGIRWSAAILDVAIFALATFALLKAIGAGFRAWRRRAGLCPSCGYPRSTEACPECGRRADPDVASPASP